MRDAVEPTGPRRSSRTGRRVFNHDVPPWIDPEESEYFITVCCKHRGANQLCTPEIGPFLLESARFYVAGNKWFPFVFLLMPDHLHMVTAFGRGLRLETIVEAWKRYAATAHGIVWQRGFFEHRLRRDESADEKIAYIRQNPVRAELVSKADAWPFQFGFAD